MIILQLTKCSEAQHNIFMGLLGNVEVAKGKGEVVGSYPGCKLGEGLSSFQLSRWLEKQCPLASADNLQPWSQMGTLWRDGEQRAFSIPGCKSSPLTLPCCCWRSWINSVSLAFLRFAKCLMWKKKKKSWVRDKKREKTETCSLSQACLLSAVVGLSCWCPCP